jgi:hypothetical protein
MVPLAFGNLEGQVAMKHARFERGQSILRFAILMPLQQFPFWVNTRGDSKKLS